MNKAEFYGMLGNLRKKTKVKEQDMLFKKLADQINDPNPLRSKVLTLHLLIEYWLDKILEELGISNLDRLTFYNKNEEIHNRHITEDLIYNNIKIINKIRNIYAHEIDIAKLEPEIDKLLQEINFSKNFEATSKIDRFLAISIQTMFQVEEKYYEVKFPEETGELSDEEIRQKLIKEGKLFWQYCTLIDVRKRPHYVTEYILKCPYCLKGEIIRSKDNTPGFKESDIYPCQNCGLGGDGSTLDIKTVKKKID